MAKKTGSLYGLENYKTKSHLYLFYEHATNFNGIEIDFLCCRLSAPAIRPEGRRERSI